MTYRNLGACLSTALQALDFIWSGTWFKENFWPWPVCMLPAQGGASIRMNPGNMAELRRLAVRRSVPCARMPGSS